jgi:hypothetical protein
MWLVLVRNNFDGFEHESPILVAQSNVDAWVFIV